MEKREREGDKKKANSQIRFFRQQNHYPTGCACACASAPRPPLLLACSCSLFVWQDQQWDRLNS
ncbi:hypothetical protein Patl1_36157 [Pistacia atlantica]|nr:hypothetical protein Patl1_36157 [Pistacia atlantica]